MLINWEIDEIWIRTRKLLKISIFVFINPKIIRTGSKFWNIFFTVLKYIVKGYKVFWAFFRENVDINVLKQRIRDGLKKALK